MCQLYKMESGEKILKKLPLFLPNSGFIVSWSIAFSIAVILYFCISLMVITFRIDHDNEIINGFILTLIVICICFIDTVISVNTCFIRNGKLITSHHINLKKYMSSWMIYSDFIVIIILVLRLILLAVDRFNQGALSVFNLFICLKFYNIYRYQKRLKFYYFREYALLIFQFAKYAIFLGFLCHTVGCLFFMIDALMIQANWYPIQQHWLIDSSAMSGLYYAPIWKQYLYSFYFSLVTLSTIAYGDITPLNPTQTSFVMVILAFLLLLYAYIFTQIYEVVTFFSRQTRSIKQKKQQISHFLEKQMVSLGLRGRIITQYEYRILKMKKTDKDQFINDVSFSLSKKYNETKFHHQANKFMPRFIRRAQVNIQGFNELISEDFLIPQKQMHAVYTFNDTIDRRMYFVASNRIFRTIRNKNQSLTELAEGNRWLGVYCFITSQFDPNQYWSVQTPMEVLSLKFSDFRNYLKHFPKSNQIFNQQCHHTLYFGGTTEDLQKCLLCWQEYHPAKHCRQYRPTLQLQILRIDKNYRKSYKRKQRKSTKYYKTNDNVLQPKISQKYCQVNEISFLPTMEPGLTRKATKVQQIKQKVWIWPYYMNYFNI